MKASSLGVVWKLACQLLHFRVVGASTNSKVAVEDKFGHAEVEDEREVDTGSELHGGVGNCEVVELESGETEPAGEQKQIGTIKQNCGRPTHKIGEREIVADQLDREYKYKTCAH